MSAPTSPLGATGRAAPAVRGRLRITEKVVERIAVQAVSEVEGAGGRRGGLLGLGARSGPDVRPGVEVAMSADSVDLAVAVAVGYPVSLRAAAQRVREYVADRVQQLTGIPVHRVDVDVVAAGRAGDRAEREVLR